MKPAGGRKCESIAAAVSRRLPKSKMPRPVIGGATRDRGCRPSLGPGGPPRGSDSAMVSQRPPARARVSQARPDHKGRTNPGPVSSMRGCGPGRSAPTARTDMVTVPCARPPPGVTRYHPLCIPKKPVLLRICWSDSPTGVRARRSRARRRSAVSFIECQSVTLTLSYGIKCYFMS
jgi:hypothetical protein